MITKAQAVELSAAAKIHGVSSRQLRFNRFLDEAVKKIREAASYGRNHVELQLGTREFNEDMLCALRERGFAVVSDDCRFIVQW